MTVKKIINRNNPIDFIEDYLINDNFDILRDSNDEITIKAKGKWRNYNISLKWDNKNKIIEVNSYFDMSKKNKGGKSIYSLISNVNKKVSVGFFNYCSKLNTIFLVIKFQSKVRTSYRSNRLRIFLTLCNPNVTDSSQSSLYFFIKNKIQFMH